MLPSGGTFAFALQHIYPIPRVANPWETNPWNLDPQYRTLFGDGEPEDLVRCVEEHLKGSDASLYEACQALDLSPRIRLFMYMPLRDGYQDMFLFDHLAFLDYNPWNGSPYGIFHTEKGVTLVKDGRLEGDTMDPRAAGDVPHNAGAPDQPEARHVYWVTPRNVLNKTRWPYVGFGNEASLEYEYVQVCLILEVAPVSERVKAFAAVAQEVRGEVGEAEAENAA
ncbi:hypothetical protein NUW54_g928 [Trametes sanguinea]|uniref:Uncharacterized protein n=1 Tax=Trametes sanguinea TaxID=158606 RepID=A0ACC1Q991_9APHY|nr:hypothetical protein NUW54_g928 [Trametes sanguinea]